MLPVVVTVRGWDTTTVVGDLAAHLVKTLAWANDGNVLAFDAAPIEGGDRDALAARVGALVLTIDFNQPAPLYPEFGEGDAPDQADVRIVLEQFVSSRSEDRPMLLARRRDVLLTLAPLNGNIG